MEKNTSLDALLPDNSFQKIDEERYVIPRYYDSPIIPQTPFSIEVFHAEKTIQTPETPETPLGERVIHIYRAKTTDPSFESEALSPHAAVGVIQYQLMQHYRKKALEVVLKNQ